MQTPQIHISDKKSIESFQPTFVPQIIAKAYFVINKPNTTNNTGAAINYGDYYLFIPNKCEVQFRNSTLKPGESGYLGPSSGSSQTSTYECKMPNMIRVNYYNTHYGNNTTYVKMNPKYFELKYNNI